MRQTTLYLCFRCRGCPVPNDPGKKTVRRLDIQTATCTYPESHGKLEPSARALLTSAGEQLHLSARAFHRVLRVARTIADLEGDERIGTPHVAEAIGYRPRSADIEAHRGRAIA